MAEGRWSERTVRTTLTYPPRTFASVKRRNSLLGKTLAFISDRPILVQGLFEPI